jgi:hypothetical protein
MWFGLGAPGGRNWLCLRTGRWVSGLAGGDTWLNGVCTMVMVPLYPSEWGGCAW